MIAYHGSVHTDLKQLKPFTKKDATIAVPCVYLTTDKTHAALYIWDKPYYWFTYGFDDKGRVHYTEYFTDALSFFYKHKKGAIYTCEGDFQSAGVGEIKNMITSINAVNVRSCEIIMDVYEYLLRAEAEGKICITYYHQLTTEQKAGIKRQVDEIRNNPNTNEKELEFINQMFIR